MQRYFVSVLALSVFLASTFLSAPAAISRNFDRLSDAQVYCAAHYRSDPTVVRRDNLASSPDSLLYVPGRAVYVTTASPDFNNPAFGGVYLCHAEAVRDHWLDRAHMLAFNACPSNAKTNYFAARLPGDIGEAIVQYPASEEQKVVNAKLAKRSPQGHYCSSAGSAIWNGWSVVTLSEFLLLLQAVSPPPATPVVRSTKFIVPITTSTPTPSPAPISRASEPPANPEMCRFTTSVTWWTVVINLGPKKKCTVPVGPNVFVAMPGNDITVINRAALGNAPLTFPLWQVSSLTYTGKHGPRSWSNAQLSQRATWATIEGDLGRP